MPHVIVIGGPNGVGKSTAAPLVLQGALQVDEFVNADTIAKGLSAFEPDRVALAAGRIMLGRLQELADSRANFAFETTLASRSFAPWIKGLIEAGYEFHLVYYWLPNAEAAVARVQGRVRDGGHAVPEETIRRRYSRGLTNFFKLYQPLAKHWRVYNNSDVGGPQLIAEGEGTQTEVVLDIASWEKLKKAAYDEEN